MAITSDNGANRLLYTFLTGRLKVALLGGVYCTSVTNNMYLKVNIHVTTVDIG